MKITYVTADMNRASGASKSGFDVLKAILHHSDLDVITLPPRQRGLGKFKYSVNWRFVKRDLRKVSGLLPFVKNIAFLILNLFVSNSLKVVGDKSDVLLVNSFCKNVLDKIDLSGFKGKKVCVVRGSVSSFKQPSSPFDLEEALAYLGQFDEYIFVSANTAREWFDYDELKRKSYTWIPNCCDEVSVAKLVKKDKDELRAELYEGLDVNEKSIFISCIGSVQTRKGQDLLVESIIRLLKGRLQDQKVYVSFVGGAVDGFDIELQSSIAEQGFGNYFNFVGYTNRALDYLYSSDLMVLPSRGEALPRSVLEAMALGVPVIGSNVDGIPELIDNESGGLLFDLDVEADLDSKIARCIEDYESMREMADYSKDKYSQEFSRQSQINRYGNLIQEWR